jgi:hypothetical protein
VSQVIDEALKLVTAAGKNASKKNAGKTIRRAIGKTIKRAIKGLNNYEEKYHSTKTVARKMAAAEAEDKSSTNNRVSGPQVTFASSNANVYPKPSVEEPTRIVEFLIHRSFLDQSPIIVKREPTNSLV